MKRRLLIAVVAPAALLVSGLFIFRLRFLADLPRLALRDGGEVRVLQVSYTPGPSDSIDHNLDAPRLRWRIYRHLPSSLRESMEAPTRGIGYQSSDHPALSVWWAHFDPVTRKPMLGEAGDVLMTVDSGQRTNLGWPDPADDYRQIFISNPPTDSKRLTFEFPVWGEWVRFSIDNPAYRR